MKNLNLHIDKIYSSSNISALPNNINLFINKDLINLEVFLNKFFENLNIFIDDFFKNDNQDKCLYHLQLITYEDNKIIPEYTFNYLFYIPKNSLNIYNIAYDNFLSFFYNINFLQNKIYESLYHYFLIFIYNKYIEIVDINNKNYHLEKFLEKNYFIERYFINLVNNNKPDYKFVLKKLNLLFLEKIIQEPIIFNINKILYLELIETIEINLEFFNNLTITLPINLKSFILHSYNLEVKDIKIILRNNIKYINFNIITGLINNGLIISNIFNIEYLKISFNSYNYFHNNIYENIYNFLNNLKFNKLNIKDFNTKIQRFTVNFKDLQYLKINSNIIPYIENNIDVLEIPLYILIKLINSTNLLLLTLNLKKINNLQLTIENYNLFKNCIDLLNNSLFKNLPNLSITFKFKIENMNNLQKIIEEININNNYLIKFF